MAVGWDYMAESKGAAAGARIANARNANLSASLKQGNYQRQLKERERKQEEKAAAAQEATIRQSEALDRNTFYKPQVVSSNAGLNSVFDYSTQQIVDTYTSIKNDKDMDPAEQALQMRKITNQIPLIKSAKAQLDANMSKFAELSQSGEISSSMDPRYQYVYSEMLANRFDGGIDFEGDDLVFKGTMPDGEEIRLPLSDFALNLPGVDQKGGTLDDSIIGYTDSLQNEIAEYRKTGKKKPESLFQTVDGKRVLTATGRAKQSAIEELIQKENKSGNELYAYGMDTLNMSREDIDARIDELVDTPQTISILSPARLKSMYTDKGLPIPSNFEPNTDVKMTTADARIQVMEEMVNQELNVLQDVYDTVEHQIQRPQVTSYTRNIIEDVVETSDDTNASPSQGSNMDLKPGDFSVKKVTGYDTNATNLKEGFNADGEYIVSYDQVNSKFGDQPPVTTEYNLNTESGARKFLLNRYLNEQGGLTPSAKEKAEAKKLAYKNAPKLIEQMQQNYLNIMGPVKGVKPPSGSAFSAGTRSEAQDLINKYGKQQ
tara:strand:- start:2470 stop:4104 length:1635 start_codon:yes stop_codon:yes gene_type:complete